MIVRWHKGMKLNSVHELSKSTCFGCNNFRLDWVCFQNVRLRAHLKATSHITIFKRQCYGQVQRKGKMFILNRMCTNNYICYDVILCYYNHVFIDIYIHAKASLLYATPPKQKNPWVWHFLELCKIHKSTWEKFLECEQDGHSHIKTGPPPDRSVVLSEGCCFQTYRDHEPRILREPCMMLRTPLKLLIKQTWPGFVMVLSVCQLFCFLAFFFGRVFMFPEMKS